MLFYDTEGEFGDDNFRVIAKGLFLLDIGTHAYTEYDPADPDLIKFLMANPEALMMKKGHIHSHNSMAVFFSGTDNEELVDNCGFHNFYVSLIVNNRNEMCAKIAFKAKTASENHVVMSFLDQNGKEKQRKLVSKKEDEYVYVYKCEVTKSEEAVEDSFKSRFQELRTIRELKDKSKKFSEAAISEKALQGFNVDERWRQAGLWDDVRGTGNVPKGKKEQERRGEDIETVGSGGKRVSVVERVGNMRTDPRIYNMLSKMLALDFLFEGTLTSVLKKIDAEFYPGVDEHEPRRKVVEAHMYYDAVETRAVEFYIDSFPEDCTNLIHFDSTMEKCIEILESFENDFPELIFNLTEALNLEIK